jgi:hypothetical protein
MTLNNSFFGYMPNGGLISRDGDFAAVGETTKFGLIRMWDSGAVLTYIGANEPYMWDGFDGYILFAESIDADLMYTFGRPPREVCLPNTNIPTDEWWTKMVTILVSRSLLFGNTKSAIKYWEMWNEPAVNNEWGLVGTRELLYERHRSAWYIIKAKCPDCVVLTPSFNDLLKDYGRTMADEYLKLMGTQGVWADGVAFHSYDGTPEGVLHAASVLRELMDAHGVNLPLYLTETALGRTPGETADYMRRLFAAAADADIRTVVWDGQIPGAEAHLATEGLGKVYTEAMDSMLNNPQQKIWTVKVALPPKPKPKCQWWNLLCKWRNR